MGADTRARESHQVARSWRVYADQTRILVASHGDSFPRAARCRLLIELQWVKCGWLTQAQLQSIQSGQGVTVTTSVANNHTHDFTIQV
jgi:hypothetical protein